MPPTVEAEIARYLRVGEYDLHFAAWPGDFVTSPRRAKTDLKNALIAEIRRRADGRPPPAAIVDLDLVTFTRRKIEPMVRGLFPRREQEAVLGVLERSVVVLTPDSIGRTPVTTGGVHMKEAVAQGISASDRARRSS